MKIRNQIIRLFLNRGSDLIRVSWIAFPVIPEDNKIMFFQRDRIEFGFLSNFYPCKIEIDGKTWPHTEAYYQSQKSHNPDFHDRILEKEIPSWAKYVGDSRVGNPKIAKKSWFRKHPDDLRSDWDEIKIVVMKKALHAKFTQNKNLQLSLLNTDSAQLIEDSSKDAFWGIGDSGNGDNVLGNLLMELRGTLRRGAEQIAPVDRVGTGLFFRFLCFFNIFNFTNCSVSLPPGH